MNYAEVFEKYEKLTIDPSAIEHLPVSAKQTLPTTPFPRKYVHSVSVDLQDAKQAAQTLRAAGFDEQVA